MFRGGENRPTLSHNDPLWRNFGVGMATLFAAPCGLLWGNCGPPPALFDRQQIHERAFGGSTLDPTNIFTFYFLVITRLDVGTLE